jgi:isoamylase
MRGITSGHAGVSVNDAFHGDYTFFNDNGGPHKSINFIVAHDGFTLADLVSYNAKTNVDRDWPFGPSDGEATAMKAGTA